MNTVKTSFYHFYTACISVSLLACNLPNSNKAIQTCIVIEYIGESNKPAPLLIFTDGDTCKPTPRRIFINGQPTDYADPFPKPFGMSPELIRKILDCIPKKSDDSTGNAFEHAHNYAELSISINSSSGNSSITLNNKHTTTKAFFECALHLLQANDYDYASTLLKNIRDRM